VRRSRPGLLVLAVSIGLTIHAHAAAGQPDATQVAAGKAIFFAQWSPAGESPPAQFAGLGPLFNVASCVACHVGGAGGQGPRGTGPAPLALEVQLESTSARRQEPGGDPVYGRVLNTAASGAVRPEGAVVIEYQEREGYYYPDGIRWHLRIPRYRLVNLTRGPLAPDTVVKPRLAPSLLGAGLLEQVQGRFGWQAASVSIREQVSKAFALEMGLTSADHPTDDCTTAELDCRQHRYASQPEVADERLEALVAYVRSIAVPESPTHADNPQLGAELFTDLGCPACHRPEQPIPGPLPGGQPQAVISPYTDLQLHDLGVDMADEDVAGRKIPSRWRTAPLWGLGYRMRLDTDTAFLHDGRARSTEEAILWHGGEGAQARAKFMNLGPRSRRALLQWLATL
jgi:CxxC motif-containing protein (DUF1111 family)